MKKDRGKRTSTERRNDDASFNYSTPSDISCRKHPSVSAVGICPYCLNERLINLVCSECGEKRLSSCSCSDVSPNRTSNATVDFGNVDRISSLTLTDEEGTKQRKKTEKNQKTEEVAVFKRSSSSCVEISKRKHHHRFSKIGRFLRKINPIKERALDCNNNDGKKQSVSRSRSLCSFRGVESYFIGSDEDVSSYSGARSSFSAARSSSVNGGLGVFETKTEHRKSNYEGRKSNFSETTETRRSNFSESEPQRRSCFDGRRSNFSETEYPRRSTFNETEHTRRENNYPRRSSDEAAAAARKSDSSFTRRVLSVKESYFTGGEEESGFIEIKFDSSGRVVNDDVLEHGGGGSCRITTNDRELSRSRRSFKGWKWIFGHHHQRDS